MLDKKVVDEEFLKGLSEDDCCAICCCEYQLNDDIVFL